jgi:hypothetical protein
MLERSRSLITNMTRKEYMALKSLKDNKEIRILQDDEGNCMVVLNKSTYKEKTSSPLEPRVYDILCKDPMSKTGMKIWKLLQKKSLETGTSSTDWDQLSMFYLKTETESSLRNVVLNKKQENG